MGGRGPIGVARIFSGAQFSLKKVDDSVVALNWTAPPSYAYGVGNHSAIGLCAM